MTKTTLMRSLSIVATGMLLTGCAGTRVVGKVLPGTISYVGVVDHSDERLGEPGIPGVSVRIEAPNGSSSSPIATATSGPDGRFSMSIPKDAWPTDRVVVRAIVDGYASARGSVYLPRTSQSFLILMERTAAD
ncbi:MAG: hypothetical protein D6695_03815 [Planctomycetota bacterium]|nr:MAG: hypothetical protein D6695_03815 [Planctomycetota bacterium]